MSGKTLYKPDSERKIEITIGGERVCGTVSNGGSNELTVRLDLPANDWTISLHMPYFARSVHREGFLGEYGEQRARELLASLYKEQKKGDRRRKFAGLDFEEFGRIRYLAVDPGHPNRGVEIREKGSISALVYIQIEDDRPYCRVRFFDSGTNQPFLAEAAVYDEGIQEYIDGVKADLGFCHHLETIRQELLSDMVADSELLKTYRVSPDQVDFLKDWGRTRRASDMPLESPELDQLIELGYIMRNPGLQADKMAVDLEASLTRTREALATFEATGYNQQAAQCRTKVQKLERRIKSRTLMITPAGKALANSFRRKFRPKMSL